MTSISTGPLITTTKNDVIGTLEADMFGAILPNNFGWNYWQQHVTELGLTDIRFPGGEVSETGWVVDGRIRLGQGEISLDTMDGDRSNFAFDLTHPELISPLALQYDDENHLRRDDIATFSQALDFAIQNESDLGLIIPTGRYYLNEDLSNPIVRQEAIDAAVSDLSVFLERLKDGEFNDGEYPDTIRLEIGNEEYRNPIEYAVIAKAMIDQITKQLAGSDISYEVAVQMGRGSFEFNNILNDGYFAPFFGGEFDLIPGLENLDFVPEPGMKYPDRQVAIDKMITTILGDSLADVDGIRHHILGFSADDIINPDAPINQRDMIVEHWMQAFAAVGVDGKSIDYYISAFSTNSSNGNGLPFSMSAGANMLEVFAFMMEEGVDQAAVWGIVTAFRYKDDISPTTITDRLSDFYSPQAAVLQLLTENAMDADYLGSGGGETEGYRSFMYETDTSFVMFYYVESVDGSAITIDVDLGLFFDVNDVSVTNLDLLNGAPNGESVRTDVDQLVVDGGILLDFDQDFEIVMVTVDKADSPNYGTIRLIEDIIDAEIKNDGSIAMISGTDGDDEISGSDRADIIVGGAGNDTIDGGSGRSSLHEDGIGNPNFASVGGKNGDFIFGGAGDDILSGNAGNDLISGGEGDDVLFGGSGFDTFVFNEGGDSIRDFQIGVDTIAIDSQLINDDIGLDLWLADNTNIGDDSITIDFGFGNELTIDGVVNPHEVFSHIHVSETDLLGM